MASINWFKACARDGDMSVEPMLPVEEAQFAAIRSICEYCCVQSLGAKVVQVCTATQPPGTRSVTRAHAGKELISCLELAERKRTVLHNSITTSVPKHLLHLACVLDSFGAQFRKPGMGELLAWKQEFAGLGP